MTLGPRTRISPWPGSSPKLSSMITVTPGIGRPTLPILRCPGKFALVIGLVLVMGQAPAAQPAQWVTMAVAVSAGAVVLAGLVYAYASRNALHRQAKLLEHFGDTMSWPRLVVDRQGAPVWSNSKLAEAFPEVKSLADLERRVCGDRESRDRFRVQDTVFHCRSRDDARAVSMTFWIS